MSGTTAEEIPRERWQDYLTAFAEQYAGWGVTIEVLAGELGDQPRADGLPLQGISYEYKGGSQAGDVLIEMGDAGTPFETHLVHKPRVVRAAVTRPGDEADVEFESEDGVVTLLRVWRRPELPPPPPGRGPREDFR